MACLDCGLCCQVLRQHAPADPDGESLMRLFGLHTQDAGPGRTQILIPGPCQRYDPFAAQHCTDYESRPGKCREFLCPGAKEAA